MARTKKNFDPASTEPYKISRTKVADFLECPRWFWLDQRLGLKKLGVEVPGAYIIRQSSKETSSFGLIDE